MHDITEKDIKVFTEAVTEYFSLIDDKPASVRSFYLAQGEAFEPIGELTGEIALSGDFRGTVTFAAPRNLVRWVLRHQRSHETDDARLLDGIGEIANTLAGNARRHFGPTLEISPPVARLGGFVPGSHTTRARQFVIMIDWKNFQSAVIVDMARA